MGKKKKNETAEIVCILDKSGSMWNLVNDTIGGFNNFIEEQKKVSGSAVVTLVLFDTVITPVYEGLDIEEVPALDTKTYDAYGSTALLDALAITIQAVKVRHKRDGKPDNTIFCVITDGEENSSHEFTREQVKNLVEKRQEKGWLFFFLGANIDSFAEAGSLGISRQTIANYTANSVGTAKAYAATTLGVSEARTRGSVSSSWSDGLDED